MDRLEPESAAHDGVTNGAYAAATDATDAGDARLVSRHRSVPAVDVLGLLSESAPPTALWAHPDGPTILGLGVAASVTGAGRDRFAAVERAARDLFAGADAPSEGPARPRFVGGAAFHAGHESNGAWADFPDAAFVLPEIQITVPKRTTDTGAGSATVIANTIDPTVTGEDLDGRLDEAVGRITEAPRTPDSPAPGVTDRERTTSRATWYEHVSATLERIDAGELRKVVLAQALSVTPAHPVSPAAVLSRLDAAYPDCYRFLVQPSERAAFLGATPECLVSRRGRAVETEALAGSTGRGDTRAEDEWLAAELADSEKDRHEHALVVDAIRGQLEPFTAGVETGPLDVRQLATVQHLQTPIATTLQGDTHVLELVDALHPTPAVGGLPPERALATIRETETFSRGWYAAPVGWFDAAGDGEFAVAIRSALLTDPTGSPPRYGNVRAFAGAGVVADSDPDWEWDEVQLKYRPILDAL